MSCKEEESIVKLGLDDGVIRKGYDPRFWHQLGAPPELSIPDVKKLWQARERDLLEDVSPTRWPLDWTIKEGSIDEKDFPILYFTVFLEFLKTASETGYSIERRSGLHFKPYKLSVADCELLRNITSTPGKECSSTRVGYSKKIIFEHLLTLNKAMPQYNLTPKIVCHHWGRWMDVAEERSILNSWGEFLITESMFREIKRLQGIKDQEITR